MLKVSWSVYLMDQKGICTVQKGCSELQPRMLLGGNRIQDLVLSDVQSRHPEWRTPSLVVKEICFESEFDSF